MVSAKTDLQATDQQVNSYTPALPVIFDDDDWSDLLEVQKIIGENYKM